MGIRTAAPGIGFASGPRALRLRTRSDFSRTYDAKARESRGPLTVYALPNDLGHPRLGLSVSRKVGPRRLFFWR